MTFSENQLEKVSIKILGMKNFFSLFPNHINYSNNKIICCENVVAACSFSIKQFFCGLLVY